jgi:hypothetical protein
MKLEIIIPEELIPAIRAEYLLSTGNNYNISIEDYFKRSIIEFIRQRSEIYQIGPYYHGLVQPRFLQDGRGNPLYTGENPAPYYVEYPSDNFGNPWVDGNKWTDPYTNITYQYNSNNTNHWEEVIN